MSGHFLRSGKGRFDHSPAIKRWAMVKPSLWNKLKSVSASDCKDGMRRELNQRIQRIQLIRRGAVRHDEARAICNAMIDKQPAQIARGANLTDEVSSVNFVSKNGRSS